VGQYIPNPLRQVLCGWVKILHVNSKFSGRFSEGFAVSFRRFKNKRFSGKTVVEQDKGGL
jgi:hypothetical protein